MRNRSTSNHHSLPFAIALVGAAAVGGGCAAEADDLTTVGTTQSKIERLTLSGHVAVNNLPSVQHLALTASGNPALLAGDLGFEVGEVKGAFAMNDSDLSLVSAREDRLGTIVERYEQTRYGLEVVGGDVRISRNIDGDILSASTAGWDTEPSLPVTAITELDARDAARTLTEGSITVSVGELVYVAPSTGASPILSWRFRIEGEHADGMPIVDDVFIDALTGELADRHPHVHSARNRLTYDAGNLEDQLGTLARTEGQGPTGDTDVDLAHDNAGATYDCLQAMFNRDSYDGLGADLISAAHYGPPDFNNAAWTGEFMLYGDGFAVADVGTHEFVHGVTTSTANMIYQNEPGALNEAWSDVMAAVCDYHSAGTITTNTWTMGEDLPISNATRYLSNPTQDGISRDLYADRYLGSEDEGGVHINSGIANLAFYLLTSGGAHPRQVSLATVEGIGIEGAAQIYYRALTTYMNQTTDFAGARTATELAAADIYGAGSPEAISVSEAWYAVGVGGPAPERVEDDPEPGEPGGPDDGESGSPGAGGTQSSGVVGGCAAGGTGGGSLSLLVLGLLALVRRRRR